jgi:hypothetical protein
VKTTTYTCDWCKATTGEPDTFVLTVRAAGRVLDQPLGADICEACLQALEQWIASRRDEGSDGPIVRTHGPRAPLPGSGDPGLKRAKELLDNADRILGKSDA